MVIFDTTVVIELYRGNQAVKDKIAEIGSGVFYISDITVAEFLVSAKDKIDLIKLEKYIKIIRLLPLTKTSLIFL